MTRSGPVRYDGWLKRTSMSFRFPFVLAGAFNLLPPFIIPFLISF